MHTGSEIKDISQFLQACDVLFDVARHFTDLEFIDFGSGFKIPYLPGDSETPLDEFGRRLSERFHQFCSEYGRSLHMVFEPGKFIVSNAGHFLMRVNAVKQNPTRTFVQVDSGLNHFIRPMLYGATHFIENLSANERFKNESPSTKEVSVVGYICETDTFADHVQLPETQEGDTLRLANAGAYGMMMASNYNSRLRPAEVLWLDGKGHLIRRRETLEDLLSTQVSLSELLED
jgi:diaminopimelate decarboxylase